MSHFRAIGLSAKQPQMMNKVLEKHVFVGHVLTVRVGVTLPRQ